MEIPSNPDNNFIAIIIFLIGLFLFISGLNIIKIEKITVSNGLKTWVTGLILMLLGGYIGTQKIIDRGDKIHAKPVLPPIEIGKKTIKEIELENRNIDLIKKLNELKKVEEIRKEKEIADIQKKYDDLLEKEELRKKQNFEEMVLFKKKQKELGELKNSSTKQNSPVVLAKSDALNAELEESEELKEANKLEKKLEKLKSIQEIKLATAQKQKLSFQSNVESFILDSNNYNYKKTWQLISKLTMQEMRKNDKFKNIKNEADAYKNYEQFWKKNKAKFSLLEVNTDTNVIIVLMKFTSGKILQNTYLLEQSETSNVYDGWRIKERVKRDVIKK